jgi:hypothetical protein
MNGQVMSQPNDHSMAFVCRFYQIFTRISIKTVDKTEAVDAQWTVSGQVMSQLSNCYLRTIHTTWCPQELCSEQTVHRNVTSVYVS